LYEKTLPDFVGLGPQNKTKKKPYRILVFVQVCIQFILYDKKKNYKKKLTVYVFLLNTVNLDQSQ
jgi:hypothetical protein